MFYDQDLTVTGTTVAIINCAAVSYDSNKWSMFRSTNNSWGPVTFKYKMP